MIRLVNLHYRLVALSTPGSDAPLTDARDLFTAMGNVPALDETEALLQRVTAPL